MLKLLLNNSTYNRQQECSWGEPLVLVFLSFVAFLPAPNHLLIFALDTIISFNFTFILSDKCSRCIQLRIVKRFFGYRRRGGRGGGSGHNSRNSCGFINGESGCAIAAPNVQIFSNQSSTIHSGSPPSQRMVSCNAGCFPANRPSLLLGCLSGTLEVFRVLLFWVAKSALCK